jgi:hypothetical protein
VWGNTTSRYLGPSQTQSTFQPWEKPSEEAVQMVRKLTTTTVYWEKLATHYAAENLSTYASQDHISNVKSICEYITTRYGTRNLMLPSSIVGRRPFRVIEARIGKADIRYRSE